MSGKPKRPSTAIDTAAALDEKLREGRGLLGDIRREVDRLEAIYEKREAEFESKLSAMFNKELRELSKQMNDQLTAINVGLAEWKTNAETDLTHHLDEARKALSEAELMLLHEVQRMRYLANSGRGGRPAADITDERILALDEILTARIANLECKLIESSEDGGFTYLIGISASSAKEALNTDMQGGLREEDLVRGACKCGAQVWVQIGQVRRAEKLKRTRGRKRVFLCVGCAKVRHRKTGGSVEYASPWSRR